MAPRFTIGSIELTSSSTATPSSSPPRPRDETPFRMLIMANLRGQSSAPDKPLRPRRIDLDNQDTILEQLNPSLEIPFDGPGAPPTLLRFRSMDDFHPDQIIQQIPWFKNVLDLRRQLDNPKTFRAAADQLAPWIEPPATGATSLAPSATESTTSSVQSAEKESTGDVLQRLLGKTGSGDAAQPMSTPSESTVQNLIRQAVGSSAVPDADPQQAALAAAVDHVMTKRLNSILHHPTFQALEAAWRGIDYLIKNVELDENLQLFVLDLSQDQLIQDLTAASNLESSQFYQTVVAPTVVDRDAPPWALWIGQYLCTPRSEDFSLLAAISQMAAQAGAPFLTGMDISILPLLEQSEPDEPTEALMDWTTLRRLPQSNYLGLALPRFLARLPYGEKTDPIESFDFTEISGTPRHEDYLWTNSAIACACLIGQSFSQCEWNLGSSLLNELNGLPLHVYREHGESKMTPCAEIWLNDLNSDVLLENGLIPVQSIQRRDAIRLPRFQSIRHPLCELAGRWE